MATPVLETISNEFAAAAEQAAGSVVAVHARRWMPTSGIEWKKGVIVTAQHGIKRDEEIKVRLADGKLVTAKLAGRDPSTDLAVLRLDEGAAHAAKLGDSSALKLGHLVLALGAPAGRPGREQRDRRRYRRRMEKLAWWTARPAHPPGSGAVSGVLWRTGSCIRSRSCCLTRGLSLRPLWGFCDSLQS